jgi:hypothetical protein
MDTQQRPDMASNGTGGYQNSAAIVASHTPNGKTCRIYETNVATMLQPSLLLMYPAPPGQSCHRTTQTHTAVQQLTLSGPPANIHTIQNMGFVPLARYEHDGASAWLCAWQLVPFCWRSEDGMRPASSTKWAHRVQVRACICVRANKGQLAA